MVPVEQRHGSVERCLAAMVDACIALTVKCNAMPVAPEETCQAAYGVAKSAKLLLNAINIQTNNWIMQLRIFYAKHCVHKTLYHNIILRCFLQFHAFHECLTNLFVWQQFLWIEVHFCPLFDPSITYCAVFIMRFVLTCSLPGLYASRLPFLLVSWIE